ncbi:MAG: hypothetical protein CR994_07115 [Maribacter sp.]|nr:MAG: hypothetical protein CR994_07115 [Maribacter sp.]
MRFKSIAMVVTLMVIGVYGQEQRKTFNEVFNVNPETVLDINTSNVDIEFGTWNKNQIAVEATIILDGTTDEEAKEYFEQADIEIVGNSKKVSIVIGVGNAYGFKFSGGGFEDFDIDIPDFHFEMPEIPEMDIHDLHIDLSDMPMPPVPAVEFDYEAYKKDGGEYLKKWQEKFDKGFNKGYEKKMEAWGEKMAARQEAMAKRQEAMAEKREVMIEKRMEVQKRQMETRAEVVGKRAGEMEERKANVLELREKHGKEPTFFYYSTEKGKKKFKVRKSIKVKMPEGTKINMNVRHGAVKLADNTKNINAELSYSTLWAATIDGDETTIATSYSSVRVKRWNYGSLQVDYSDNVDLNEVLNLSLSATSSDVAIHKLLEHAIIHTRMGSLKINAISDSFKDIDISIENAEMTCDLPKSDFIITINQTLSKLTTPPNMELDRAQKDKNVVLTGYNKNINSTRSIYIDSKYSKVVLKE